jgi:beta-lactamase superfamily II metal-dependent hydrolase
MLWSTTRRMTCSDSWTASSPSRAARRLGAAEEEESRTDVIAPPTEVEGGLFPEINDNSVAILLTYGTARILLAGDAEANEEEYMANGPHTGPLTITNVPKLHTI